MGIKNIDLSEKSFKEEVKNLLDSYKKLVEEFDKEYLDYDDWNVPLEGTMYTEIETLFSPNSPLTETTDYRIIITQQNPDEFDEPEDTIIADIKLCNSDDDLYEMSTMPYDEKTGEFWDTSISLYGTDFDSEELADYYWKEFKALIEANLKGEYLDGREELADISEIFELEQSESLEESNLTKKDLDFFRKKFEKEYDQDKKLCKSLLDFLEKENLLKKYLLGRFFTLTNEEKEILENL